MTELCKIAKKHRTDKVQHGYTLYYHELMKDYRDKEINMLELGIFRGGSIAMWNEYFYNGEIYCVDNCVRNSAGDFLCKPETLTKLKQWSKRIHPYNCSELDKNKLKKLFENISFDFIIDDASHFQKDQQVGLGELFKNIKPEGIYIIEDICNMWAFQTGSWWGQKDGVLDTNAFREGGKGTWLEKYLKTGMLKSEETFSDSTWSVLHKFNETGKFESIYLSKEEEKYLEENIESIEIIAAPESREDKIHNLGIKRYSGTPGTKLKAGCIAIIKKRKTPLDSFGIRFEA